jgi:hypothetical protein
MRHSNRWMAAVIVAAGLGLAGCMSPPQAATGSAESKPARVETIAGSEVKRVTLTQRAFDRLAIETVPVRAAASPSPTPTARVTARKAVAPAAGAGTGPVKTVVAYSAVIYDTNGVTWVYTMPEPLTFVRQKVVVAQVSGKEATLSDGPAAGTPVATTGVAELYGAELGVGK